MLSFAGPAVENVGDHQFTLRIAIALRRLCTAVAECPRRAESAVTVGDRVGTVLVRVDDESESPVDDMAERVIEFADPLTGGHRGNGVWRKNRPVGCRLRRRAAFRRTGPVPGSVRVRCCPVKAACSVLLRSSPAVSAIHVAVPTSSQAGSGLRPFLRGECGPCLVHIERSQQPLFEHIGKRRFSDSLDDLAEQKPAHHGS